MLALTLSIIAMLSPIIDSIALPANADEGIPQMFIEGTVLNSGNMTHIDGVLVSDKDWLTMKSIIEGTDYCDVIATIAGDEVVSRVKEARDACIKSKDTTVEINKSLKERIDDYKTQVTDLEDSRDMYRYITTGAVVSLVGAVTFILVR